VIFEWDDPEERAVLLRTTATGEGFVLRTTATGEGFVLRTTATGEGFY
jgi:hypothetical protein